MLLCRQEGAEGGPHLFRVSRRCSGCSWFPHWAQIWDCKGRSRKKVMYPVELVEKAFTHARVTRKFVGLGFAAYLPN